MQPQLGRSCCKGGECKASASSVSHVQRRLLAAAALLNPALTAPPASSPPAPCCSAAPPGPGLHEGGQVHLPRRRQCGKHRRRLPRLCAAGEGHLCAAGASPQATQVSARGAPAAGRAVPMPDIRSMAAADPYSVFPFCSPYSSAYYSQDLACASARAPCAAAHGCPRRSVPTAMPTASPNLTPHTYTH